MLTSSLCESAFFPLRRCGRTAMSKCGTPLRDLKLALITEAGDLGPLVSGGSADKEISDGCKVLQPLAKSFEYALCQSLLWKQVFEGVSTFEESW